VSQYTHNILPPAQKSPCAKNAFSICRN
jgi:hypothetical protein